MTTLRSGDSRRLLSRPNSAMRRRMAPPYGRATVEGTIVAPRNRRHVAPVAPLGAGVPPLQSARDSGPSVLQLSPPAGQLRHPHLDTTPLRLRVGPESRLQRGEAGAAVQRGRRQGDRSAGLGARPVPLSARGTD